MPQTTLLNLWRNTWQDSALCDLPALTCAGHSWTYAELAQTVQTLAGGLRQAGVAHGDFVALALERGPWQALVLLGVIAAGACPCPLEPRLAENETRRRITAVGLRWFVHDDANWANAQASGLPPDRCLPVSQLRHGPTYWTHDCTPDDPALLLFTSGSTGRPKGVLLTHQGILTNALGVIAHTALTMHDRLLHIMPLHHTNAINNQLFAPLACGASVHLAPRFRAENMPDWMAQVRPTIITGVPTMYARMLVHPIAPDGLQSLRLARCGSAPITSALHQDIEAYLGCDLVVSYGLSEATCTSTMNPPGARRVGTVGTVLQGQRVVLLDVHDQPVAPGAEGEICITGPTLMQGYLGHDGEPPIRNGLLHTGDLGCFDADGYLSITGRIKDVIIRGGENLSPRLIEDVLSGEPGVAACCVVGLPDADLGEVPIAAIVAISGETPPDSAALQATVAAKLGRIYVPQSVYIVDRLPENSVGKIDRKAVAALLATMMTPG